MNDLAREVLVKAALDGVKQIKGKLYDGDDGYCAVGVLCEDHRQRHGWQWVPFGDEFSIDSAHFPSMMTEFGLTAQEWMAIVEANNNKGWDFLTIARKVGVHDESGS